MLDFLVIAAIVGIPIGLWLLLRPGKRKQPEPPIGFADGTRAEPVPRQRLTRPQQIALCMASFDKPVYAENPRFAGAQTPNNTSPLNQRTIDSLVRKGWLHPDQTGGYLLTEAGLQALRNY